VPKKIYNKTIYISPNKIKYCINPSIYCDYNQFELSKYHPHAGINRGVFDQCPLGCKIINTNWDTKPGILFTKLLEYVALENHFTGKENWKNSIFAKRNIDYIKKKNSVRGFTNFKKYLVLREKQIDRLFGSIMKKGIFESKIKKKKFNDNISVVLTQNSKLYFNNRGHHRLSIAKILNIKEIPVQIVVAKSVKKLENFYLDNI
jgi:hypothetical protein